MRLDCSAALLMLACLDGRTSAEEVLNHPAYQRVVRHYQLCHGRTINPQDLADAVRGVESPLFGLRGLTANRGRVEDWLALAPGRAGVWLADARAALGRLAGPDQLSDLVVYPIIGYDAGIGLNGAACLNILWPVYLDRPEEFGYMLVHELCHALYGRIRPLPDIAAAGAGGGGEWHELFCRMTADEGFAVWSSLALRRRRGHMGDGSHPILEDYVVLADPGRLAASVAAWHQVEARLRLPEPVGRDQLLGMVFGPDRLTYRAGCAWVNHLERTGGPHLVRQQFGATASAWA